MNLNYIFSVLNVVIIYTTYAFLFTQYTTIHICYTDDVVEADKEFIRKESKSDGNIKYRRHRLCC